MSEKETKEIASLIANIQSDINFAEKHFPNDSDNVSWGYEEGVLISVNQAKLLLDKIKTLEAKVKYLQDSLNKEYKRK